MVVVDGGSEDGTEEYCKSFGDKMVYVYRKWDDHFSEQFNQYLKHVHEGWVLICDDDEFPSEELLGSMDNFVNNSRMGKLFCSVQFKCHDIWDGVPNSEPANYWKQLLYRWNPNMRYAGGTKTGCHQYIVGHQSNRGVKSDLVYYHDKDSIDSFKGASRNYFIYGLWPHGSTEGTQTEEWYEMKEILARNHPDIKVFPDLSKKMEEGTVCQEFKDWMVKWYNELIDHPDYNEMRAVYTYYFEYLHPEEEPNKQEESNG
jgi:glycosyltransferase involved in cell wall biosynthesis